MQGDEKKLRFSILHADNSVELILKEIVRHNKTSIYEKNRKTIDFYKAMDILMIKHKVAIPERSDLEYVHDMRNLIQHKGANVTPDETEFYLSTVFYFLERIIKDELNLEISKLIDKRFYHLFRKSRKKPSLVTSKKILQKKIKEKTAKVAKKVSRKKTKSVAFKTPKENYYDVIRYTNQLDNLARQAVLIKKAVPEKEFAKIVDIVKLLSNLKIVDPSIIDSYKAVKDFRNRLIHTDYFPSQKELENFQKLYSQISTKLEKSLSTLKEVTAKIHKVKIPKGSSVPDKKSEFQPKSTTVSKGDLVYWVNEDDAAHTVTSGTPDGGPDGIFDSSMIMSGISFHYKFDKEGVYPYFDLVHPWLTGLIKVIE